MVLVEGMVREYAAPADLLADTNSLFYHMAKDARLVWYNNNIDCVFNKIPLILSLLTH